MENNRTIIIENIIMAIIVLLAAYVLVTDGAPQTWSGRTCDNIRCLGDEVCVMEQGQCDYRGQCGRQPTCRIPKRSPSGSCEQFRCPPGQYCTMFEDKCNWKPCPSRPVCVTSNNTGSRFVTNRPW